MLDTGLNKVLVRVDIKPAASKAILKNPVKYVCATGSYQTDHGFYNGRFKLQVPVILIISHDYGSP
jgi:hypothetical protein